MLVRDTMNRNPLKINDNATVKEAVEIMALHQAVDLIVVGQGDRVVGMIGVEEMLRLLIPDFDDLLENDAKVVELHPYRRASDTLPRTKVTEVMREVEVVLEPDQALESALGLLLKEGGRTLPVVEGEKLAGGLSASDLVRSLMWRHQVAPSILKPEEERRKQPSSGSMPRDGSGKGSRSARDEREET
jgi:acetoin utilization protein AcuB